ncbi:MAG: MFS transporter [Chloroflexi bacterium]|nr:MAG: MFS transporter [Chloroflexota bacterium]MBL1196202.1 MFS transporter [Chloroflexota bacterium]NOH13495.1 MFS transporter [Chloroflexota bacterium]
MRTFLTIWVGQVISVLGSGLTNFALGVWIFQQTGEATPFALTVLFGNLPQVLLSPLAGALIDRWNRRLVLIVADTGSALTTFGAFLLLLNGELQVWHIFIIAAVGSVFQGFQEPAYMASITMLVPKEQLGRASGMVQMGQALTSLISPLLAGFLFVAIGLEGIILVDFATFFFAIGALLFVRIPQPKSSVESAEGEKPSVWQDAAYGWRYVRERQGLFGLLWYFAMVNFFLNFSSVLAPPMILSFADADALGLVQAAGGLGMLLGSIIMSAWGGPKRAILGVIGFISLIGVGFLIMGLQASILVISAGIFIGLFAIPIAAGTSQVIFQRKVAPDVQGRVFAIRAMISRSMMPLAFLLAGPLADRVFIPMLSPGGGLSDSIFAALVGVGAGRGIGLLFVFSGAFVVLVSILAFANPRIRNVESELPDLLPEDEEESDAVEENVSIDATLFPSES